MVLPPGFDLLLRVRQTEEPMLVKGWGIRGFKWEGEQGGSGSPIRMPATILAGTARVAENARITWMLVV